MNEANLTGEGIPIPKSKIESISSIDDKYHWLYEGSKLETMKEETLALAISTGFSSKKGLILRKILHKSITQPDLLKNIIKFHI